MKPLDPDFARSFSTAPPHLAAQVRAQLIVRPGRRIPTRDQRIHFWLALLDYKRKTTGDTPPAAA